MDGSRVRESFSMPAGDPLLKPARRTRRAPDLARGNVGSTAARLEPTYDRQSAADSRLS
jgi:hypothetical protein